MNLMINRKIVSNQTDTHNNKYGEIYCYHSCDDNTVHYGRTTTSIRFSWVGKIKIIILKSTKITDNPFSELREYRKQQRAKVETVVMSVLENHFDDFMELFGFFFFWFLRE